MGAEAWFLVADSASFNLTPLCPLKYDLCKVFFTA